MESIARARSITTLATQTFFISSSFSVSSSGWIFCVPGSVGKILEESSWYIRYVLLGSMLTDETVLGDTVEVVVDFLGISFSTLSSTCTSFNCCWKNNAY